MKNMPSPKKRKLSIEEKIRKDLYRVPKWRRKYLYSTKEQEEYLIRNMKYAVEYAGRKGSKVNIYKAFIQQASQGIRAKREGTLRDIYKDFKSQEIQLYNKYNSYMYRNGYNSAPYFYNSDNVSISDEGYTTVIVVELPIGKNISYTSLYIEYDWSENKIINASMI